MPSVIREENPKRPISISMLCKYKGEDRLTVCTKGGKKPTRTLQPLQTKKMITLPSIVVGILSLLGLLGLPGFSLSFTLHVFLKAFPVCNLLLFLLD